MPSAVLKSYLMLHFMTELLSTEEMETAYTEFNVRAVTCYLIHIKVIQYKY